MAYVNDMACCACLEVSDLHDGSGPADNLQRIFEECQGNYGRLPGHLVFTAFVKCNSNDTTYDNIKGKYGHELAAYIEKNNLGSVIESVSKPNRINHPDHLVKVWVFSPHEGRMIEWAKAHRVYDGDQYHIKGDYY